ncbi:chitosanase [Baekduia sp. Peel2402]|uniref:chitosanase n=1 Tax=Baekduia sp. Peel2402 TaxID=3458296 RepID=UPI00403EA89C
MARKLRWTLAATAAACLLFGVLAGAASATLTPTQRRVADQLVSVFENSTTKIRYDYIANLHDGCGLTAGRAGFCSATGDMLLTVETYASADPTATLAGYLPVLRSRAEAKSDSTRGLGSNFEAAWRAAASDSTFRDAQDAIVDQLYYEPAVHLAAAMRLRTPLATAIFYDTAIQHGTGKDPDGLITLIGRTRARLHALPGKRVSERRWLATFLRLRRADLKHPHNRDRRADWPESVGRVDAFMTLLRAGRTGLNPPLRVDPWGGEPFVLR